jgi:hypothetical protein
MSTKKLSTTTISKVKQARAYAKLHADNPFWIGLSSANIWPRQLSPDNNFLPELFGMFYVHQCSVVYPDNLTTTEVSYVNNINNPNRTYYVAGGHYRVVENSDNLNELIEKKAVYVLARAFVMSRDLEVSLPMGAAALCSDVVFSDPNISPTPGILVEGDKVISYTPESFVTFQPVVYEAAISRYVDFLLEF